MTSHDTCNDGAHNDAVAVRERIASDWAKAAAGWARWESSLVAFLAPVAQTMLQLVDAKPGARVLDVACGTGEPALAFARAVGPTGSVLGVDLSGEMLEVATARAEAYGLKNVTFKRQAAEELDDSEGGFDAAVSRFGVIFFPDMVAGLRRIRDLLACGGRFCVSTWTLPEVNPAFAIPSAALRRVTQTPPPPPDTPGPFRLAGDGELAIALEQAGFADIHVEEVVLYQFTPDMDTYWRMLSDLSVLFRTQYDALNPDQQQQVREEIASAIGEYECGGVIRVPARARVAVAVKPAQ